MYRIIFFYFYYCSIIFLICVFISSRWFVQKLKIDSLSNDIIANTKILEQEEDEVIVTTTNYIPKDNDAFENETAFKDFCFDLTEIHAKYIGGTL